MRNGRRTCHAASGTVYKYLNFKFGKSFLHALPGQRQHSGTECGHRQRYGSGSGGGGGVQSRHFVAATAATLVRRESGNLPCPPLQPPLAGNLFFATGVGSKKKAFFFFLQNLQVKCLIFNDSINYLYICVCRKKRKKNPRKTHNQTRPPHASAPAAPP